MTAILDVSAAIEIILKKDKAPKFEETYQSASWIISPSLYIAEIANVFWKYQKAGILKHEECVQYTETGIALVDDFQDLNDLWKESQGEAIKNNHSVYDMFYAVLARRNDAILLTNDKELASICKKLKIQVCI
jgi:predicted nucleic acid-binding protein